MDPIEIIFQRRSVRKFTHQAISNEEIEILLKAAMAAPSAVNSQPWEFIVVDDPAILKSLKKISLFSNRNAPLAMVVLGSPQKAGNPAGAKFWIQDCSAAMENILLAAVCLGLGGVWIGIHPIQGVDEKVRELLRIPPASTPLGMALIGHPAEKKEPLTRYKPKKVHWQKYGNPHPEGNQK
jgi:nitroreductase